MALEYPNICEFAQAAGLLKYLSELEEWRRENRGLAVLLSADTLIRKKVYKLNHNKRKDFPTFGAAMLEVLTNHNQQAAWERRSFISRARKIQPSGARAFDAIKEADLKELSGRQKKNKVRREKQKALLKQATSAAKPGSDKQKDREAKVSKDSRSGEGGV